MNSIKISDCQINTWKSLEFLYTNPDPSGNKIKKWHHLQEQQPVKYLGTNLNKDIKESRNDDGVN